MLNSKLLFEPKELKKNSFAPTSQEMYIRNYLEEMGIKYKAEYKIENLSGDHKSYRKADFYLPKLKIYVEYFGMYNSTKPVRTEYDKKAKLYINNSIPTVFLYPHELGFLDYAFHTKILRVLRVQKFKNNFTTVRYKLSRYLVLGKPYLIFLSLFSAFLSMVFLFKDTGLTEEMNTWLYAAFMSSFVLCMFSFLRNFLDYFFKDY